MKKIISVLVAIILTATLFVVPSFAADNGKITITGTSSGKAFNIYRIFDLSLSDGEDNQKSYSYTINEDFKAFFTAKNLNTDQEAVDYFEDITDNSDEIKAFAEEVKLYALTNTINGKLRAVAAGDTLEISNLPLGYYLVYPEGGSNALCALTTTDPETSITVKSDYPTINKNIIENSNKVKTGVYAVNETITFELKSKVPDMTGYDKYYFVINDTLDAGFDYIGISTIDVGSKSDFEVDVDYSVTATDKTKLKIVLNDFINYTAGDDIVITYTAKLNSNAVLGSAGNVNEVLLIHSDDPYFDYQGTNEPLDGEPVGVSPKDYVKAFTFKFQGTKVNDSDETLSGAKFSLWTPTAITGADTKTYKASDSDPEITLYKIVGDLETGSDGIISHSVKNGTYYLYEDVAPSGYNALTDPIIFTVSSTTTDGTLTLDALDVADNSDVTATLSTGLITTEILNKVGTIMPETGGIGTTIFTVLGILIMAGAVLSFIVINKKKTIKNK